MSVVVVTFRYEHYTTHGIIIGKILDYNNTNHTYMVKAHMVLFAFNYLNQFIVNYLLTG